MLELKKRIKKIRKELNNLDLVLPGSITVQWYSCKKKGCKCMDKENPVKHGPYYQLSYTIDGKSSTMLIKDKDLVKAKKAIKNYRRFRELNKELLQSYISLIREEGFPKDI